MSYKKCIWAGLTVCIGFFCLFVLFYEQHMADVGLSRLEKHAHIIANDLWDFNYTGAEEYLKLAAEADSYENITVLTEDQKVFLEIDRPLDSAVIDFLVTTHLVFPKYLSQSIQINNESIGQLEVVWLPTTIFIHGYMSFALLMLFFIFSLYLQLLGKKQTLEQRVQERTSELERVNEDLRQEIDKHAQAQTALVESEKKHRFLAENIQDLIFTTDLEMQLTYLSPVAMKMFGWSQVTYEEATVETIFTAESIDKAKEVFDETYNQMHADQGITKNIELELEASPKDGVILWLEITASFFMDEEKNIIGLMGVARNVTERIRAKQERDLLERKLEQSRKMESLGLLAGGVAHDLNNVLSGVVSYPELILMDLPQDSPLQRPIKVIRDSGIKAAKIVEDLLTITRRGVMATTVLSLNALVEEYLESPEHSKMQSFHPGVQVFSRLAPDLLNINGAAVPIGKTIMNLVSNAAEAQSEGGCITITTGRTVVERPIHGYQVIQPGEYAVLSVADKGEGISEVDLQRIFDPFYTKKVMGRSGTGLGLTVVWGTIKDHRGFINILSEDGVGTTFDLYFPLAGEQAEKEKQEATETVIQGAGELILVVDDMDYQLDIASEILSRLGYKVEVASSGEEAVSLVKKHDYDLVVLDMIMEGGIDGLETFKEIIQVKPGQKVVIASGYSETSRVKEAQQLGAGQYVKKPYVLETFGKVIRDAFASG